MKTMKRLFLLWLLAILLLAGCQSTEPSNNEGNLSEDPTAGEALLVTDMIGREVELPPTIESVYSMGSVETIILYTVDPDYLAGWNYELTEYEAYYIGKPYTDLPVLGGWFGKDGTGNIEEIIKASPDLIIGTSQDDSASSLEKADRIQNQTGIPVYMLLKTDLSSLSAVYRDLGKILGEQARVEPLVSYIEETLEKAAEVRDQLKEEDKVRVYYAEGEDGLQSETKGSTHAEVLDTIGADNVVEVSESGDYGRVSISIEQVLAWDPEVIVTDEEMTFYKNIRQDLLWQDVKAVKNDEVIGVPHRPYFWIARPPSVNQILGVRWLGNELYPEYYNYDAAKEIKDFFSLFYHYDLNEEELEFFLS